MKKSRSFLILCPQIQYLDLSTLLHRITSSLICIRPMDLMLEFYPRGCYLLALCEMLPEQGPQLAEREDEVAPGDSTALLATRFSSLRFNFVEEIFLLLTGFTEPPQTASEADT